MNTLLLFAFLTALALGLLLRRRRTPYTSVNYGAVHEGGEITRFAEAAIADSHLMIKKGTGALQVAACGATDLPLGLIDDDAAADEECNVGLLDGTTRRAVAAVAISVNDAIYTAANGQVTNVAVAGCYYVGRALTAAAAQADEFELATAPPVLVNPTPVTTCTGSATGAALTVSGQVKDALGNSLAGRFIVGVYFGEAANDGTPHDFGDLAADTGSVLVVEHTADAYCEVLTAATGAWGVVLTVGADDTVESNAFVVGKVASASTAVDVP